MTTNYERIKQMSIDEKKEFFRRFSNSSFDHHHFGNNIQNRSKFYELCQEWLENYGNKIINNMKIAEMAEWLRSYTNCEFCCSYFGNIICSNCKQNYLRPYRRWLESEAE